MTSPSSMRSPNFSTSPPQEDHFSTTQQHGTKRPKLSDGLEEKAPSNRRKTACHSCRKRKVKCDNTRPACGFCQAGGIECVYTDQTGSRVQLDPANRLLLDRIEELQTSQKHILKEVGDLNASIGRTKPSVAQQVPIIGRALSISEQTQEPTVVEPSKDYLQIPTTKTSADTVLTWPIWKNQYPRDYLIENVFRPPEPVQMDDVVKPPNLGCLDSYRTIDVSLAHGGRSRKPLEQKVTSLINSFLQNVHTKNPLLDVRSLVAHGKEFEEKGFGWDSMSCLVLIACALGSVSRSFDECLTSGENGTRASSPRDAHTISASSSAVVYQKDLEQGESYFMLACRRLGLLKHSVLGAQCYFFAGVYLMYTMRPLSAWHHFYQASIFYLLYIKTLGGPLSGDLALPSRYYLNKMGRQQKRAEQNLYWSCFKSECEFRVELPVPQSDISSLERADLFPSPPSPGPGDPAKEPILSAGLVQACQQQSQGNVNALGHIGANSSITGDELEISKEESWYYYLTEIALRRIGNRIINTFYRQEFTSWIDIQPLIGIALEFDAQVSEWSANLPPAMQQYETSSSIKAPSFDPLANDSRRAALKELSWATDNRILEMRSWLYQPFLYYAIHRGFSVSTKSYIDHDASKDHQNNHNSGKPDQFQNGASRDLTAEENAAVHDLIVSGIECNLKILEVRSLKHRHHGLWYDLRAIVTASLILLALVQSGNLHLIPGGFQAIVGSQPAGFFAEHGRSLPPVERSDSFEIRGRLRTVVDALSFWSDECPDLKQAKELLQDVARKTFNWR